MRGTLKRLLFREVRQGEMFPRFYGRAWHSWARDTATCMPIPLNVVAGFLRWLYFTCVQGFARHHNDQHGRHYFCRCENCGRVLRAPTDAPDA